MKLLMENWRGYLNEEPQVLTEEELNELLQEIGALKSMLGRVRGGKKFAGGYGWEAAVEQWEDEDAQKAAQETGIPGVKNKEDLVAKIKALGAKAHASKDPQAQKAIQDLTTNIAQTAQPEPDLEPTPDPEPEPDSEPDPESTEISVDKAECDELFDIEDPAIQKLLDQAHADNTIRGKVAEIGRDFSFSMDAVTLSILGVALIPGGQPALAAAPITAGASVAGSVVAVTGDLLNGEWKQAALDAIGLIPMGGPAGKAGKTVATKSAEKTAVKAAAKAGKEAAAEAAAQGAKKAAIESAAQAASKSAKTAVQAFQKAGTAVTAGVAKAEGAIAGRLVKLGVEEGLSQTLAKTIMHSSKMKLQDKINSMLGDAPQRSAYETDEEHRVALRKYYDERKATSAKIYASCFADTDSEITKSVKQFLDQIHDWVDDVPRWLGTAIEWGMDMYGTLTGKDVPTPSSPVSESLITESQYNRLQAIAGIKEIS